MSSGGWTRTPAPRSVVQAVPVAISSQNFDTPHRGFLPASLCNRDIIDKMSGEFDPSKFRQPIGLLGQGRALRSDPHVDEPCPQARAKARPAGGPS